MRCLIFYLPILFMTGTISPYIFKLQIFFYFSHVLNSVFNHTMCMFCSIVILGILLGLLYSNSYGMLGNQIVKYF